MADRNPTTNMTISKANKQRYPRPELIRAMRQTLFFLRRASLITFTIYIIISLAILIAENNNNLSVLLNMSKDLSGLVDLIGPVASIPIFIVIGTLTSLGYWSEKDERNENLFLKSVKKAEVLQQGVSEKPRKAEVLHKRAGEELIMAEVLQSPPTGFKLRHTLVRHSSHIYSIAWSPDGQTLASGSQNDTICLWNLQTGQSFHTLRGDSAYVISIAWSPDGQTLASGSEDNTIKLWDPQTGKQFVQTYYNESGLINIAWSPDGQILASGSTDNTIKLWDRHTGQLLRILTSHTGAVYSVAWSPDGQILASGSIDRTIKLWNPHTGHLFLNIASHTSTVYSVAWSPDGQLLASGSEDCTIKLWNPQTGQHIRNIEGMHTGGVYSVSFSSNGLLLGSKSRDGTVHLWRTDIWECVSTLYEYCEWLANLSFHPTLPILATLGKNATAIRIWDLDIDTILSTHAATSSSYTNAKVVLLGDSGVGKSGLGLVLSGQPFSLTESTHARRIWNFDQQEVALDERRKETRETLLWDLAGQAGYRLIHQLHLNEVAVALVVFDAHSETDPFAGVYHWDRALRQAQRVQGDSALPLKKILVQARVDRGGVSVSPERIKALIDECGFDGYFETSAKEEWHISDLRDAVCNAIDWDALPKVSSTQLFQDIKAFLIAEKKTGRYLSTVDDLYSTFLKSSYAPNEQENLYAQFETCIGRVEAADLIKRLSFGKLVLLQPELLDTYASALINSVRDEPDGLGSIEEERIRTVDFRMPTDERIKDKEQEKWLLIAMIEDMLRHELALREGIYLVFPSQSTRENPDLPDPDGKAIIFAFEGPVLNIYATLAVRLSQSGLFRKQELWKNAITYNATVGGICGLYLHNIGEGRGELTLFFNKTELASEETCFHFEEFIQAHLQRRAIPETVKRRRIFACAGCSFVVTDQLIRLRSERGFNWVDCPACSTRIILLDREERITATLSPRVMKMDRAADEQRDREAAKSTIQGKEATMDFDVFLCHHGVDKPAVKRIGEQLKEQGLLPWLDEWELRPGLPWQRALEEQIEHIKTAAVFVGKDGMGPWQQLELEAFLREFVSRGCPVIPVLLDYAPEKPKLPVFLRGMTWVDFRKPAPDPMEGLIWGITGKHGPNY